MITRYITAQTAAWASELATLAFAWLVFFGASACIKYRLHPSIDMLVRRLPVSLQFAVRWFNHALLLSFFVFMTWFGARFAVAAWSNPSPVLRLPLAFLYGPVAFCFALMIVRYLQVLSRPRQGNRPATGNQCGLTGRPAILMIVLFALEVPIGFAIAISALSFFLIDGEVPLNIFIQKMVATTDSYPLLALPFFVFAGAIMNKAGITRHLLALADAMVGHMTGALAQMCTVLATLLGGLDGVLDGRCGNACPRYSARRW